MELATFYYFFLTYQQGCDIAYFFIRMRPLFLTLNAVDVLCLVYVNFSENKILSVKSGNIYFLFYLQNCMKGNLIESAEVSIKNVFFISHHHGLFVNIVD